MDMVQEIKALIKGDVANDRQTLETHSRDASIFEIKPALVIYPRDNQDLAVLVRYASSHHDISLTARSAGTDMTGGPLTNSIVLDFTRYFNHIISIQDQTAITQPGVYYRDFERETLKHHLILPSFPASREICTVGGMAANNSGGEKTLTYGKTARYVKELQVILSDGQSYTLKPLTVTELEAKKSQQDFEGQIYRQTHELLEHHYDIIQKAKPNVSKNSSGYALWDVWDRQTFDLTKLFVGSQGTLGLITQITYGLINPKDHARLLVLLLKPSDLAHLPVIINRVLGHRPETFESFDRHTLSLALEFLPDLVKVLKGHFFKVLWQFLPEFWLALTGGMPELILLAEFTADTEEEAYRQCQEARKDLAELHLKSHITRNESENQKYRTIRRQSFNLLRRHMAHRRTAPFIDDLIVRPEQLAEFLPRLNALLDKYHLTYTMAGHVGDGNFHIIPLMDMARPDSKKIIIELSHKVYDLIFEFKGSITAEHNDGLIRSAYLEQMYGPEVYDLFKKIKVIFDPKNIFNPGKKVNVDPRSTLDHIIHAN